MKAFATIVKTEFVLYMRGFFGPFFSLLFPILMLFLFGSIYGNTPEAMFGGRGAMDVSVPAYLGMVIAVGGVMTLPLGLLEYQASRAYKRFDATPVGKVNVVLAQILVYLAACVVSSAILVFVGKAVYDIRIDGAWYAILPVYLLSLTSIFAVGFLITALFKNPKIAQLVSYLLYFLMLFLSGASMPAELFPENIRTLSNALPLTHAVKALQGAFFGEALGADAASVVTLAVLAVVCAAAGILLYRRRNWA